MKWDSTDLRVGLMVVGAIVVSAVTFVWVGRLAQRDVGPLYTDVSDVQGIGPESPVFLNGYNIGRVSEVRPHPYADSSGQLLFRIRMNIAWKLEKNALPLTEGVRARVEPPALNLGRGSIILELPKTPGRVALKPGAVVPSAAQLGGTTNRMQLVVDSVGRDLRLAIARMDLILKSLQGTVAAATATMQTANATLASVNSEVPGVMAGVRKNLASADTLIRGLQTVTPATVATLDSVRALLGDSRVAIARVTTFLDTNEPQLTSTIANLDMASAVLSNMLKEVSRRPLKAITGVKPPEMGDGDVRQTGAAKP